MSRSHVFGTVLITMFVVGVGLAFGQGDGYIGIYSDAAGTLPCTTVPPLSGTTLYVIAKLEGASAAGISGAEFRIQVGNAAGWSFSYTAPPANIVMGNPLDGSGLRIAFGECREPGGGQVSMGTISVINFSGGPNNLFVKRHSTPSNPGYQCALFTLCDDPVFSKVCMTPAAPDSCVLGVQKPTIQNDDPVTFTAALNAESGAGGSTGPAATFQLVTTLQGALVNGNPWSPTDQRFAFFGVDGGLYIFDAATPADPAICVFPPNTEYVFRNRIAWSPDGQWIVCRTQTQADMRAGLSTLIARNADGTGSVTTLVRGNVGPFIWAHDGTIYWWDSSQRRSSVPPPLEWQPGSLTMVDRPFLQPVIHSMDVLSEFQTEPEAHERQITISNAYAALVKDVFPDSQKYLMIVEDKSRGFYGAVVDQNGTVLVDLGAEREFIPISVSPGGEYILGFKELVSNESVTGSPIFLAASDGTWRVAVEPETHGVGPQFARSGDLIVFQGLHTGDIHVGHLQVSN